MTDPRWLPTIRSALCNGCGLCVDACPTGALGWQDGKAALVAPDRCIHCANCEMLCPLGLIEVPIEIVRRTSQEGDSQ